MEGGVPWKGDGDGEVGGGVEGWRGGGEIWLFFFTNITASIQGLSCVGLHTSYTYIRN